GIPEYIPGIINVRGEIVSITDLKRLFDLKAGEPRDNRYVLILSTPEMAFGILADRILGVREILTETLHSSIPALTGVRADYLKGLDEAGTIVLDGDKLLTDEDLVINQNNH
ncbi:MAG: chemotaxis protein CheW, partial [Desulfobacterales bacterium]|nr:chemotaxis protein CheW [Desulfobacterales bacterium]